MTRRHILGFIFVLALLPVVASATTPIDTQPSSDGTLEASLIGLKVRNGVLTVKFSIKNVTDRSVEPGISFAKAYYIDIKERKKYFGLKDEKGMYIAGPVHYNWDGGFFKQKIPSGGKAFIWIKFPAPSEETEEIDIYLPGFLPFEGIKLKQ
jgi:hypothetical protein